MVNALSVVVRSADTSDLTFLAEAHRSGHAAVANERGGKLDILLRGRTEPFEDSFGLSIDDESTTVLIADVDGLPVGYVAVDVKELANGELIATVNDLWVHPDARGVGAGAALMRKVSEHATATGCVGIDARALPGDRVTKNFFESFGLVARTIEVHKAL